MLGLLRGQDILLTLKKLVSGLASVLSRGKDIEIGASKAHSATKQATASGLVSADIPSFVFDL